MIKVIEIRATSAEEAVEKLRELAAGSDLLGLDRKPGEGEATTVVRTRTNGGEYRWEPSTVGGKSADEATLLTIRRDLTALRERLLKGASRRAALRDVDYTIDQIDNILGEK